MPAQNLIPIDLDALGRFSIGEIDRALYLDGNKVVTSATVALTRVQAYFAVAAAIAAILGALATTAYTLVYIWSTFHKVPPAVSASPSATEPLSATMLGCIGPFAIGRGDVLERTLSPEAARNERCADVDAIKELIDKKQHGLVALSLVGAADKFPASASVIRSYGSNDGLAQARTEWVARQLNINLLNNRKVPILNLIRGPNVRGIKVNTIDSAADRTVTVYGLLQTQPPPSAPLQ